MYNVEMNKYCGWIYLISNAINEKKYIGQTRNSVPKRWYQHKYDTIHKNDNVILHNAMNKYGIDNFKIEIIDNIFADSEDELLKLLDKREIHYIKKYNTKNPNGYNMTRGGETVKEYNMIPVDAYDANGNLIYSFDGVAKASNFLNNDKAGTDIVLCCKGKRRYAYGYIWRYRSDTFDKFPSDVTQEELDADNRCIMVDKYTTDGIFVKTYSSMAEASLDCGDDSTSHISECCKGRLHSAYGYIWRYHGDDLDLKNHVNKNNISVNQYTLDDKFVQNHKNMASGYISLGLPTEKKNGIGRCCRGERKTYHGFKWFYANDSNQPDKTKIFCDYTN